MAAGNAELYVALPEWQESFAQCIALTTRQGNPRCLNSNNMSDEDKNAFLRLLEKSPLGPRKERAIIRFVPYLCCSKANHRKKVQRNVGNIQRTLVARYDPRIQLANITAVKYFVSYTHLDGDPRTVFEELRFTRPSPKRLPEKGFVYIFSWPDHPEYIKIGYTGRSVEQRVTRQDCFPNRTILNQFEFAYPERIEQLVHPELDKYRYEIMRCETCGKNHTEWLKVSASEAIHVIAAWNMLVQTESLYVGPRELSAAWKARVSEDKGKLTAHRLLKMIKAEARRAKRTSVATEPPNDTDNLATELEMLTIDVSGNR